MQTNPLLNPALDTLTHALSVSVDRADSAFLCLARLHQLQANRIEANIRFAIGGRLETMLDCVSLPKPRFLRSVES